MAALSKPGGDSALATLEEAVHLLRRASTSIWICHPVGSAPFALALLFFWNSVTNPRTSSAEVAASSLALAVLLVWMSCWRAAFSIRLRSLLSGTPDSLWTPARVGRLVADQSLLGATKLIAMPLSVLIVFPLAVATAFYRYATVLEGPGRIAKARKLATIEQGQGWMLVLLLQFLALIVAINVALALAVLPQIARMLTGYESSFSRSGVYFISNPLFAMLALVVTWIVFEPFAQAVYTVRCFHLESLETGEDLRAGLRRVRSASTLACVASVLVFLTFACPATAAIPREQLEESIQQAVKSPEYDWRLPSAPSEVRKPWGAELVDRMIASVRSFFEGVGKVIREAFRWLAKQLGGGSMPPLSGAAPSGLDRSIYVLIVAAVGAAAWFAWRSWKQRRIKPQLAAAPSSVAIPLDAEDLSPDRLPEEEWLVLAEQCLREENFRLALRALYLANLAWLGRRELLTLHSGKTNHEYEAELRRRGRAAPEARNLFAANIAIFERGWYGTRAVSSGDVGEFRRRTDEMKQLVAA